MMAKGYWITFYRSISDPAALAAYAKIAGPTVIANKGRFLARGGTVKTYEQGIAKRTKPLNLIASKRQLPRTTVQPIRRHSLLSAARASGTCALSRAWTETLGSCDLSLALVRASSPSTGIAPIARQDQEPGISGDAAGRTLVTESGVPRTREVEDGTPVRRQRLCRPS